MAEYVAPLKDMKFVLEHVVGLDQVNQLPGWEEMTEDVVAAILEEAAKLAGEVLSPLNAPGDRAGAKWKDGDVTMPAGFREAYRQYIQAGWNNILSPTEFGGQGLPHLVATPVEEMWGSANLAFKLCPMLTQGAIEAIHLVGHTPGSIALLYDDPSGTPHLFTGDCLFPGGVGNTFGDEDAFERLYADVRTKLFDRLPDETWFYPGHGDDSTLGNERPHLEEWRERGW